MTDLGNRAADNAPLRDGLLSALPQAAPQTPATHSGQVIALLGPPRSGSSAVMRGIACLDVYLGRDIDLRAAGPANPEGFWEDKKVQRLCERFMAESGMQWDSLRLLTDADIHSAEASASVATATRIVTESLAQSPHQCWGLKNPRMARMIPIWMAAFHKANCEDRYVITLRNPLSVAASVINGSPHRGAGAGPTHLHLIWLLHMLGALEPLMAGKPAVIVDYDCVLAEPVKELQRIAHGLNLPASPKNQQAMEAYGKEFLNRGLRHSVFSPDDVQKNPLVPPLVVDAYTLLLAAARDELAPASEEFRSRWRALAAQVGNLKSVFDYLDHLDRKLTRRRAVAIALYRHMPLSLKRFVAGFI